MNFRLVVLLLFAVPAFSQQPNARLHETLERLDKASAHFTSAQAEFKKDLYDHVVRDTETQNGKVYFLRQQAATEFGMLLLTLSGAPERIAEYKNGTVKDFNPKTACYSAVHASAGKIETFLTLGFGGSGKDLDKSWSIKDVGPEKIDGVTTEHLDLEPRDADVKANLKSVSLWIDLDRDVSLKQVFHTSSGDTQTAIYSNIRLNQKVDTKPFQFSGKPCGK